MSIDHKAEARKYAPDADEKVLDGIIKHLGIALRSRDASFVSCSSKDELARVRDSWLKKKLALKEDDAALDGAIKEVCETMKPDRNKSRVAFYYLLVKKFDKTSMFA